MINIVKGKPATSGKRKALPAAEDYPDRHFLRVMDAGFPPRWQSQMQQDSQQLIAARLAAGRKSGWMAQGGTVLMPGTPTNDAPGWIRALPEGCSMAEAQAAKLPNVVVTPYTRRAK